MLAGLGITAHSGQILLTQGTSQALELIIRYLLKPGDAALVDDPGYYNMFGNLRLHGVKCWRYRAISTARTLQFSRNWRRRTNRRCTSPSR